MRAALEEAAPDVSTTSVDTVFDALAELQAAEFGALLVNVEPLEHRAEPAVRSLREQLQLAPGPRPPRLVLFGRTSHEPLARRAVEMGGDDYVILPAQARELREALTAPAVRSPVNHAAPVESNGTAAPAEPAPDVEPAALPLLPDDIPLTAIVLDALTSRAGAALPRAVERINTYLPTAVRLELADEPPEAGDLVSVPLVAEGTRSAPDPEEEAEEELRYLVLHVPAAADEADRELAQHDLKLLAIELAKVAELDSRHRQLQRLALTDDLTGCYNRRYFRHFLEKIIAKARSERFPVTLLLFDIDDFKHYNDRHGHRIGDAILKQTAELIKRCVRDHDLVARIGGDEFAVVFWELDAPRVPHDPASASGGRFPKGPLQIATRFRKLLAEPDFFALGATGKGSLTISGGMAVYPFDGRDADELVEAADRALIFGSKRSGKNGISLVGSDPEQEMHTELDPGGGIEDGIEEE